MPCKDRVRHLDYTQGTCWKQVLESEDRAHASAASGDAELPVADGLIPARDHAQSLPELLALPSGRRTWMFGLTRAKYCMDFQPIDSITAWWPRKRLFAARAYSILELQDSVQLVLRARDENWAALARSLVLHRKSSVEGLLKRLLLD